MFYNYIIVNPNRNLSHEAIIINIVKFITIKLFVLGVYKLFFWLKLLFHSFSKHKNQKEIKQPIKKRIQPKRNAAAKKNNEKKLDVQEEEEENQILTNIKNDFNSFNYKTDANNVESSSSLESMLGVATAAATAASIFIDKKRNKANLCGKCCAKKRNNV